MNSKNSILLVDPNFDPAGATDCILLIKVSADSFSYAIIDRSTKQLQAVYDHQECQDVPAKLSLRIKTDSYLTIPFKEVKIAVYTECSIAIPNELFSEQSLNEYAKFFPLEQSNNLYTQSVDSFGFKSIFTLNDAIDETINSSLGNCRVFDHSAPVLKMASGKTDNIFQLDFTAGSFNAVYIAGGKLVFQKYFETENAEEFNYYLLYIINQLNIDTMNTEVFMSGIIHQGDAYYTCITKYFNTIQFTEALALETDNKILDDMPAHYYSSLLALELCE